MTKHRNENNSNIDMGYLNRKPIFNVDELSLFTGISKSTVYKYTSQKLIPHFIRGKFLFFDKKEILEWLKEKPVSSIIQPEESYNPPGGISIVD